jgi:hypothetical protein
MITSLPRANRTTESQSNSLSHSPQDILLVSSALSSLIPLIPWSVNCTVKAKEKDQLEAKSKPSIRKSVSKGFGED